MFFDSVAKLLQKFHSVYTLKVDNLKDFLPASPRREVIVSYAFCVYCRRRQVSCKRGRAYNVESLGDQYRRLI
jgi:hypothetical protein